MRRYQRFRTFVTVGTLLGVVSIASPATAINERWYMIQHCKPKHWSSYHSDSWEYNRYGLINVEGLPGGQTEWLLLVCPQPHFVGNNGFDPPSVVVYNRHTSALLHVRFCRHSGGPGIALCDHTTVPGPIDQPISTNLNAQTDSLSYYFWEFDIPSRDPLSPFGGGYSGVVSTYFDDN